MEYSQAKEIVRTIIEWQFWMMGIKEKPSTKLDTNLSLQDLIDANAEVVKHNKEEREKHSGTGKAFTQHQTLADRIIAAVYVAMNYSPNGEAAAVINGIGVGCVKMKEAK